MPGKRHTKATVQKFFRLVHTAGIKVACAEAQVSYRTGMHWLRLGEREVIRRSAPERGNQPNVERDARIQAALAAGVKQSEIARREGVTRQMVSLIVQRLRRDGLLARDRRAS